MEPPVVKGVPIVIPWRTELHFMCDGEKCMQELLLDQMDARTKRGMYAVAMRLGWTWEDVGPHHTRTLCPACTVLHQHKESPCGKQCCSGRLSVPRPSNPSATSPVAAT